jgi:hypothetical protein
MLILYFRNQMMFSSQINNDDNDEQGYQRRASDPDSYNKTLTYGDPSMLQSNQYRESETNSEPIRNVNDCSMKGTEDQSSA